MNKYVLSALVVPVALMGAVTAQAKTTLLKATVNQAKSGTKVVSGKATRGAKIKISRAGVTYGVAKANKHGHFVMKLKRAVKGGWTYKVTVTKAGFKVKSGHFKVKKGKKQVNVVKPSKATPTTPVSVNKPNMPVTPSASAKPVVPNPTVNVSNAEAGQISMQIDRLNGQINDMRSGRLASTLSSRLMLDNQINQLLGQINQLKTVGSQLLTALRNAWNGLHQNFMIFVNGVVGVSNSGNTGNHPVASSTETPTKSSSTLKTKLPVVKTAGVSADDLKAQIRVLNEDAAGLDVLIYQKSEDLKNNQFSLEDNQKMDQLRKDMGQLSDELTQQPENVNLRNVLLSEKREFDEQKRKAQSDKMAYQNTLDDLTTKREQDRNQVAQKEALLLKLQLTQKDNMVSK